MTLVVFDVVVHVLDAVLDEVNGPLAFPVAANPVLSCSFF